MNLKRFRKGEVEKASWRRWALNQTLEDDKTQVSRKLEPCQASPGARAQEASSLQGWPCRKSFITQPL